MDILIPQCPQIFGGYFVGLQTCKDSAQFYGNAVHVLEGYNYPEKIEFWKIYKHNSPNPMAFERWCFEHWFLVRDWMRANSKAVAFKSEGDVLIFENLDAVLPLLPKDGWACTVPFSTPFITLDGAEFVCNVIMDAFRSGRAEAMCSPHIADITMFGPILAERREPDTICGIRPLMVDGCFTHPCGGDMRNGCRDLFFCGGKPYYFAGDETVRLLTLHLWGPGKTKVRQVWEQSRKSLEGGAPVRLTLG